jgi:predicted extracellular nuclease
MRLQFSAGSVGQSPERLSAPVADRGRPSPVPPSQSGSGSASNLRVAQMNMWNFFDTVDDPAIEDKLPTAVEYRTKIEKIARSISQELGNPDIISLNEIENERVLADLLQHPLLADSGYRSIVGTLNDGRGIRVGMLYRDAKLDVVKVSEFNPKVQLSDPGRGQLDQSLLYARAPLIVDFHVRGVAQATEGVANLTVVTNHFKSKLGGDGPEVRRVAQGEHLAGWVDARRAASPNVPIMVVGDLNATYEDGAYKKLAFRPDGSPRMTDVVERLPESDRYTYIYRGRKDLLDHMLVTPEWAQALKNVRIPHFNTAKGAMAYASDPTKTAGTSDHDPIVADFDLARLIRGGAGVAQARTAPLMLAS